VNVSVVFTASNATMRATPSAPYSPSTNGSMNPVFTGMQQQITTAICVSENGPLAAISRPVKYPSEMMSNAANGKIARFRSIVAGTGP
jgi:hypothetical protein